MPCENRNSRTDASNRKKGTAARRQGLEKKEPAQRGSVKAQLAQQEPAQGKVQKKQNAKKERCGLC